MSKYFTRKRLMEMAGLPIKEATIPGQPIKIDGKEVDLDSATIGGVDKTQGPDDGTTDAYFEEASFKDGVKLTDMQLEKLNDDHYDVAIDIAIEDFHMLEDRALRRSQARQGLLSQPLVNKEFDEAFNLKMLKNIKFILGQWEFVDEEMKKKPFGINFKNLPQSKPVVDKALDAASKEHPAVADMTIVPSNRGGEYAIEIRDGNYAGLTFVFEALDDAYGEYGSSMGWDTV